MADFSRSDTEVRTDPVPAFDEAVRAHEARLLRVAYRILGNWADAEEAVQEAFLKLHRHGMGFATGAALSAWLYRVAVNHCLDRARAKKPSGEMPELTAGGQCAESMAVQVQRKARLETALAALPPRERAAVVLREIEEMSTAEVAAAMGVSEATVRSQVAGAMTKLRARLKE